MHKKSASESGLFNPRAVLAFSLCLVGASFALLSLTAAPPKWALSLGRSRPQPAVATAPEAIPQSPTTAGMPRYQTYSPGPGVGENAAEPSIGYNPATKKAMYIAGLQTLQVTFPENIAPLGSVPTACDAEWLDVSYASTSLRSVDPILFTDQVSGRTFVSQLNTVTQTSPVLIGLNSLMAFTDDDGLTWTPAQVNPPDGSNDHQTVGGGPYPASLSNLGNAVNKGRAVYYCGQGGYVFAITSVAYCSRSDDGGLNFGKSVPAYTDALAGCSQAIHGHVKVAPDGTVYLPNAQCGGGQAVAVSTDAGTTWAVRTVPGSEVPSGILDPSVAISKDPPVAPATSNTMYFSYTGPEGGGTDNHAWVAVTKDRGLTWSTPFDIGASMGIKNAAFVSAVAGDSDRAAVAFLGTTTSGDHQAANFQGTWYGFIAHTYDGGQTWITVNATPNGPVQRNACIWNGGGSNPCRNLLDFNDATVDEKGRVLFAYADGCINDCETGGPNSYSAKATIARQSGGKGVFAQFDLLEPALANRACLSGCRDDQASYLKWTPPDNGGSDITGYKIYRSDAASLEALIGQQTNPADNTFTDRSVDPTVSTYTYRMTALNALGEGPLSNSVSLPLGVCVTSAGPCALPGVTTVVDPAGDPSDGQDAHDITSVSMAELNDVGDPTGKASNVVVTIKVASFTDAAGNFTIPPGWRWSIRFGVIKNGTLVAAPPSGIPGDASVSDYFVSMVSDGQGPSGGNSFTWGVTSTPNGTARLFTTKGNIDPSSNVTEDGNITLVVPKSIIQNPNPGDSITVSLASVRLGTPSGGTNETIPDSSGAGSYTLRSNNLCLPNTAPLAVLDANVSNGVKPLQVNFDASGSFDPDTIDTIASYTFNFGDGGDDVTQTSPTISHLFNETGQYVVRMVVTDSRGKVSSNTAQFIVNVNPPLGAVVSRKVHGTAGTFDLNLPLTGSPGVEPRTGATPGSHTIVFIFGNTLTSVGGASVTSGNATISSSMINSSNPHEYIVNLTGVANAQNITVSLSNVTDSEGGSFSALPISMGLLTGDINGNKVVSNTDVSTVKGQVAAPVSAANFRSDVNSNGVISNTDVSTTKSQVGLSLP